MVSRDTTSSKSLFGKEIMAEKKKEPSKKPPTLLDLGVTLDGPRGMPGQLRHDPLQRPPQGPPQSDSVDNYWYKRTAPPGSLF